MSTEIFLDHTIQIMPDAFTTNIKREGREKGIMIILPSNKICIFTEKNIRMLAKT